MEDDAMDDKKPAPEKLPGNHGQFGTDNATEDYKRLKEDLPASEPPERGGRG